MDDDEFGSVAENNLELINEEEKKYEVENQFMQQDAMTITETEYSKKIDNDLEKILDGTGISETTSKSQYFSSNSSKFGNLNASAVERPNLGLENIKRYLNHMKTKWNHAKLNGLLHIFGLAYLRSLATPVWASDFNIL